MNEWKRAAYYNKTKRIDYKAILGYSLTRYVMNNSDLDDSVILSKVLSKIKKKEELVKGWDWRDITKNIKISISARRTEQAMWSKFKMEQPFKRYKIK